MSIKQVIACDVCGKTLENQKGWLMADTGPEWFFVQLWSNGLLQNKTILHLCSTVCCHEALKDDIAKKLTPVGAKP